jgi:hypothetical protein
MNVGVMEDYKLSDLRASHVDCGYALQREQGHGDALNYFFLSCLQVFGNLPDRLVGCIF